jgi:triphosphoribosyl-dephospho-CoA synthetase
MISEDEREVDLKFFYGNVERLCNHKETLTTFKHFLRCIEKLKIQSHTPS